MKNATGIFIGTDGSHRKITANGYAEAVEEMRCDYFDILRLPNGADMWIDDCGRINGSKVNLVASILATERLGTPVDVFGDVIVFGHDGKGETIDCPSWVDKWMARVVIVTDPFRKQKEDEADGTSRS